MIEESGVSEMVVFSLVFGPVSRLAAQFYVNLRNFAANCNCKPEKSHIILHFLI